MSIVHSGKMICCDGQDCERCAQVPVALNSTYCGAPEAESPDGWLFVASGEQRFHFCPECIPGYLQDRWQFARMVPPTESANAAPRVNAPRAAF